MKTFQEQILSYAAYHRDTRNKLTHFIGVPLVAFSVFLFFGWFRFVDTTVPLSMATVFYSGVFLYYLRLDWRMALVQLPFSLALLYLAERAAVLPLATSAGIFAATFVGGWAFQLLGHKWEGRRPALVDNFMQVFNAPMFLAVEAAFVCGQRVAMRDFIEERLRHVA